MFDPREYWEARYAEGGGSGRGSRGRQANRKAAAINRIIARFKVQTVVDWGCGDGVVAARIRAPRYIGLDVSPTAIELCRVAVAAGSVREWHVFDGMEAPPGICGDLALSLDVIFHLTDEALYRRHLELLFASAPMVCITSSNRDEAGMAHVLHRQFLGDIPAGWKVVIRPRPEVDGDIGLWLFRRHRRKRAG